MKLLQSKLEIRKAYFLEAFGRESEEMAIVSFAGCNLNCPYCKRDMQYIDKEGEVIKAVEVSFDDLIDIIENQIKKNRRIRLSGGDPCVFQEESVAIARYIFEKHGRKISLAHNATSASFIRKMLPYVEYVAVDFKAFSKERLQQLTGVSKCRMQQDEIIRICREHDILVDIRTPIFADTTKAELVQIAEKIRNRKNVFWTLRKYSAVRGCELSEPSMEEVTQLAKQLKNQFPSLKIGTRNYWKGGFQIF